MSISLSVPYLLGGLIVFGLFRRTFIFPHTKGRFHSYTQTTRELQKSAWGSVAIAFLIGIGLFLLSDGDEGIQLSGGLVTVISLSVTALIYHQRFPATKMLEIQGVIESGEIVKKWRVWRDEYSDYYVGFVYLDGYRACQKVSEEVYDNLVAGMTIQVIYSPKFPRLVRLHNKY